jgi:transcription elongation factor GreA-like protein
MLQVLVNVFLKVFQLQKEAYGYAKENILEKMGKCPRYQKQEIHVLRSIVELG